MHNFIQNKLNYTKEIGESSLNATIPWHIQEGFHINKPAYLQVEKSPLLYNLYLTSQNYKGFLFTWLNHSIQNFVLPKMLCIPGLTRCKYWMTNKQWDY